jgi:hypothetical protein
MYAGYSPKGKNEYEVGGWKLENWGLRIREKANDERTAKQIITSSCSGLSGRWWSEFSKVCRR